MRFMRHSVQIVVAAALALALNAPVPAAAQSAPARYEVPLAYGAGSAVWDVPALQNGRLLALQASGVTNGATVAVRHLVPHAGGYHTNTVESALAPGALYAYPEQYVAPVTAYYVTNGVVLSATSSPPKPVVLVPGDRLTFALSATNASARITITAAVR